MNKEYCVRGAFDLPEEFHGHPGGISRVVLGPDVYNEQRPDALDSERLIIHTNEYAVGGDSGHAHAFYILEGTMEATVGDKTYTAGPGDCVFLPRNVMHGHRNIGDVPLKFLFISTMLDV